MLQCWLLFCVRMVSPVPCVLSTMMLCLLKLMKHTVIWSLLLYWRHSTWLGKLYLQEICTVAFVTALCPGLPGWASSRKVQPISILVKQETVSGSGISWAIWKSAPCSRQVTTPAPRHWVLLQAGCPSCHPTDSVKALKAKKSEKKLCKLWEMQVGVFVPLLHKW